MCMKELDSSHFKNISNINCANCVGGTSGTCGNCHWGQFLEDKKSQKGFCVFEIPQFTQKGYGYFQRPNIEKSDFSCNNWRESTRNLK